MTKAEKEQKKKKVELITAIKYMQERIELIKFRSGDKYCERNMRSCEIAIKALEKQLPKIPNYEGDGYDDNGELIYDTYICPNCETHYEVDYDRYKYCPECGQAMDLVKN